MIKDYNKLVRDNIPKIIEENGSKANTHQVKDREELITLLLDKVIEETNELRDAFKNSGELDVDELIDLEEVLDKLKVESSNNFGEIKAKRDYKAVTKGRFDMGIVLESVEED